MAPRPRSDTMLQNHHQYWTHRRERRKIIMTQEKDYLYSSTTIAQAAELTGWSIVSLAILIGLGFLSAEVFQGSIGVAMFLSGLLPSLAGGVLLVVAGRILRVVDQHSRVEPGRGLTPPLPLNHPKALSRARGRQDSNLRSSAPGGKICGSGEPQP